MVFIREIGTETGAFLSDRLPVTLQIVIIYVTCSTTIAASLALYPRAKKRQYYSHFLKNRQTSTNVNGNGNYVAEYHRPLVYRDFFLNNKNKHSKSWHVPEVKTRDAHTRKNRMSNAAGTTRYFERADGMMRILSFPLKEGDPGIINGFEPGDPAADCLTGGLDAGVVNGALKIGIGVGLAPGCGLAQTTTEKPPKLVPVPVFITRPVPVPQPYPVAIDVPRPVPIHVPQPVPFPSMSMGSMPMMAGMPPFSSRLMTISRACSFQNCGTSQESSESKNSAKQGDEYAENTVIPEMRSRTYRSPRSTNQIK